MIKRNNKKGFTIVELVIVIAVIAILAAVLIPTFSGIIAKANESADIKAVREMNTAYTAEFAVEKPADIDAVIDALAKNGFNSKKALIPVSKDYKFMWSKEANCIVLLDGEDNLVFPTGITYANDGVLLEESVKFIDASVSDSKGLADAINGGTKDITLSTNVDQSDALVVAAGDEIVVDLGGKNLATATRNPDDHQYAFNVYGTLTITNGTIDARGVEVRGGGKLVIGEGATVNAIDDNGGAAIYLYPGAEVVVEGGTFTAKACKTATNGGSVILNNGGKITINGGTFTSEVNGPYVVNAQGGETIINGGTFNASRGVVAASKGTVTINGGTFTKTSNSDTSSYVVYAGGTGVVTINGGKFNCEFAGIKEFTVDSGSTTAAIKVAAGVEVNGTKLDAPRDLAKGDSFDK